MGLLFEYPKGIRLWIFNREDDDYGEWLKEKMKADEEAYRAMLELKRFVRNEQSKTVVVEALRLADQEAEWGSSEAIIDALVSTVAKLSQELDELREG